MAIRPLEGPLKALLEDYLEGIESWIPPDEVETFQGPEGRIRFAAVVLFSGAVDPGETATLRALGAYLGQAIVEETGWQWCIADVEGSDQLAIKFDERGSLLFPIGSIVKRMNDGENYDPRTFVPSLIRGARAITAKRDAEG